MLVTISSSLLCRTRRSTTSQVTATIRITQPSTITISIIMQQHPSHQQYLHNQAIKPPRRTWRITLYQKRSKRYNTSHRNRMIVPYLILKSLISKFIPKWIGQLSIEGRVGVLMLGGLANSTWHLWGRKVDWTRINANWCKCCLRLLENNYVLEQMYFISYQVCSSSRSRRRKYHT